METGPKSTRPCTVEEVCKDFKGRRAGMLKALTSDFENFFRHCDPEAQKLAIGLYGLPDEGWEVRLPSKEVPPKLPEPTSGINLARDGMEREDWLSLVAVHSDAWLSAVSSFYGSRLDKNERRRLLLQINELPTLFDVVTGKDDPAEEKLDVKNTGRGSESGAAGSKIQRAADSPKKRKASPLSKEEGRVKEDEEERGDKFCDSQWCRGNFTADEFRRGCDFCEKWYHGGCINMTPAKNEHIKRYKCPSCCIKATRTS